MGALRTKLESFKQPHVIKSTGHVSVQNLAPKGIAPVKDLGYSKAFWMARALSKDEEGRQAAMLNSHLQTLRRGGTMDADSGVMGKLDEYMQNVDNLLEQLGITDGGEL